MWHIWTANKKNIPFYISILNEFAYSIADTLSLESQRSGTKFVKKHSLSTDVALRSAIRIAKFILGTQIYQGIKNLPKH